MDVDRWVDISTDESGTNLAAGTNSLLFTYLLSFFLSVFIGLPNDLFSCLAVLR